jgi:hypothetical protein
MILYSIQFFAPNSHYSRAVGRRLVPRHRAQRIAAWLNQRGHDAYIAPARITK